MSAQRPLALLGGTFDPIHLGHLRVAWEAAEALDADVHLLLAHEPPHRPAPVASVEQRVAILRAALAGQQRLHIDLRELRRTGPSYSIDTLIEVRAEIGPQRSLILLLGADAFAGLPGWHRWQELFDLAHIVVLTRPGVAAALGAELQTQVLAHEVDTAQILATRTAGAIFHLPVTPLDISATQIRQLLRDGHEPRYLLPDVLLADPSLLDAYRLGAGN
ncbi:nicotinate-nucleotide adenylyltransferase [Pseudolysobacter antarcticus]|uniref:nicotinate-nucleotide adenylyltransferase n=1 Tax=Pseudolysobacter antarcticus TaxID=2511995 RepID=UPI001F5D4190|nr:nicotinate-nucleotide adenylyltransferase [Pseudolysobacter antarcticus]